MLYLCQVVELFSMEQYNLPMIENLLRDSFNRSELKTLTFRLFPSLNHNLADNVDLDLLIQEIISYANRRGLIPNLLEYVKKENPHQYKRYEPSLVYFYIPNANTDSTLQAHPAEDEHKENSKNDSSGWAVLVFVIIILFISSRSCSSGSVIEIKNLTLDGYSSDLYILSTNGLLKFNIASSNSVYIRPPTLEKVNGQAILGRDIGGRTSIYIGNENGYIYQTDDGGRSWRIARLDNVITIYSLVATQDFQQSILFAGTDHGIFRSTDGFVWDHVDFGDTNNFPVTSRLSEK